MNNTAVHDKVVASTLGVAVSQILVWLIETLGKIDIPFGVEGAIALVLTAGAGYFTPESKPATTGPEAPENREGGHSLLEVLVAIVLILVAALLLLKFLGKV